MKRTLKLIVVITAFILLALGWMLLPAAETVPQSQTVLKSYFNTGSVPTSTNYWEMIDTIFWYVNSMYTNSQAQLAQAQYIAAHQPFICSGKFTVQSISGTIQTNTLTMISSNGIASYNPNWTSVSSGGGAGTLQLTVNFTNSIFIPIGMFYFPNFNQGGAGSVTYPTNAVITSSNATMTFTFSLPGTKTNGFAFCIQ